MKVIFTTHDFVRDRAIIILMGSLQTWRPDKDGTGKPIYLS